MKATPTYWVNRYKQLIQARNRIWTELGKSDIKDEWLATRLTKHQWSIDEVMRHALGSDIRYIHVPLNPLSEQHPQAVLAQWVGDVFFRFREDTHMNLEDLKAAFIKTEENSLKILEGLNENDLSKMVEAPWKQMVTYESLIEHSLDHEMSHHGQIYFMLTYFRGPPKFTSDWSVSTENQ